MPSFACRKQCGKRDKEPHSTAEPDLRRRRTRWAGNLQICGREAAELGLPSAGQSQPDTKPWWLGGVQGNPRPRTWVRSQARSSTFDKYNKEWTSPTNPAKSLCMCVCLACILRRDWMIPAKTINKPSDNMIVINYFDELESAWGHITIFQVESIELNLSRF